MYRAKRQRKKPEKRYRADMDYYNLDQDENFYFYNDTYSLIII